MASEEQCFCDTITKLESTEGAAPGVFTIELLDTMPRPMHPKREQDDAGFFITNECMYLRFRVVGVHPEIHTMLCEKKDVLKVRLLCDNKAGTRCKNIPASLHIEPDTCAEGNIFKLVFYANVPTVRFHSTAFGCYTVAILFRYVCFPILLTFLVIRRPT